MTKISIQPFIFILSCLATLALIFLTGCASDDHSPAPMSMDSKDMNHSSNQNSH